ncbi:MAG TPA: contractile injection system tape measure protein, partial [Anseongella sp.]|nr:contractile injection system tape measure protein [Anseongella sp.]
RKDWNEIFKRIDLPVPESAYVFLQALGTLFAAAAGEPAKDPGVLPGDINEALSGRIVQLLQQSYKPAFSRLAELPGTAFSFLPKARIIRLSEEKADKAGVATDDPPAIEEAVYIGNAGLVILHPFLGKLFENVGYVSENKWQSDELQQRAVLLTQYLAGGTDDYAEYDLYLNKILTGFPAEGPLPLEIKLSAFEKAEADALLRSVVNHWRALKNTSIQGLQTTFLLRDGKVERNETGWILLVEQKGFDSLLDRIPWSFSTIKTPWMRGILNVEWA